MTNNNPTKIERKKEITFNFVIITNQFSIPFSPCPFEQGNVRCPRAENETSLGTGKVKDFCALGNDVAKSYDIVRAELQA